MSGSSSTSNIFISFFFIYKENKFLEVKIELITQYHKNIKFNNIKVTIRKQIFKIETKTPQKRDKFGIKIAYLNDKQHRKYIVMKKLYFLTLFTFISILSTQFTSAQTRLNTEPKANIIEGLSIYPNPIQSNKNVVYISSKQNLKKRVQIFNILGKQILSVNLATNILNISNLNKGVYILNITENGVSETRKLVIK